MAVFPQSLRLFFRERNIVLYQGGLREKSVPDPSWNHNEWGEHRTQVIARPQTQLCRGNEKIAARFELFLLFADHRSECLLVLLKRLAMVARSRLQFSGQNICRHHGGRCTLASQKRGSVGS